MESRLPDIFLSYSREDQATARRFAEGFEREGFSVWWDATLNPGEAYDEVTEKALNEAKAVVVLWSKKSVASRWVRAEATQAHENKTLVPVMIEPSKRPIMFELTHTADLSHWNGDRNDKAWQSYVAGVRLFVARGEPAAAASLVAGASQQGLRIGTRPMAILAAVAVIAGAIVWGVLRLGATHANQGARTAQAVGSSSGAMASSAPSGVSLAVLPFVDMSPLHDQDYFSDGLSEELLNQLAQINDLQVTGRTSSFSFKGKNEDLRVIGEKLGVNHLLEGSVRKDGQQLRITAQLIDAATGAHVWSHTYDRELKNVFAVQEELAKDVATALSVTLDVGESSRARGGTTNLDAYDKYLRALQLSELGATGLMQAAALDREAVALDPTFCRAWLNLYEVLTELRVYMPKDAAAFRDDATEVSGRIEALAPGAWWTQEIRADEFKLQHRWAEAEAAANAMLTAGPASGVEVLTDYGSFLMSVGRAREAAQYLRRARDAEPLSLGASVGLLQSLDAAGLLTELMAEAERNKKLAGERATADAWNLLLVWSAKDAAPARIQALFRAHVQNGNVPMSLDAALADKLNDKAAALDLIRKAFADPAYQDATRMFFLLRYADHFGDKDLALEALDRMRQLNFVSFYNLWLPYETGLRADPRFKQILRAMKLADYFRASGNWGDFCKPVGKDDFECH
jgi:TolB-like protein